MVVLSFGLVCLISLAVRCFWVFGSLVWVFCVLGICKLWCGCYKAGFVVNLSFWVVWVLRCFVFCVSLFG